MQQQRFEWLQRIKTVEREHSVTQLSITRLLREAEHDPGKLPSALRIRDVRVTADRLEGTYLIRIFAEFESGLRLCWPKVRGSDPPSRTRDLLDGIAATRRIPHDAITSAHDVREYRNSLVHERDDPVSPIPIPSARRALCIYFSFLPLQW